VDYHQIAHSGIVGTVREPPLLGLTDHNCNITVQTVHLLWSWWKFGELEMPKHVYGAEEARAHLPELLERAHHGDPTIITQRGKPYAAVVPAVQLSGKGRLSLLSLRGTGANLWGKDSAQTISRMRDEWE
jgi:prevent-host-death family protein